MRPGNLAQTPCRRPTRISPDALALDSYRSRHAPNRTSLSMRCAQCARSWTSGAEKRSASRALIRTVLHAWWHDSLQLYFLILILFALSFLLVRGREGGRRPLQRSTRSQFRFNYSLKFRQGVISSFFVFHVSPTARTLIITRRRLVAWASSSVLSL